MAIKCMLAKLCKLFLLQCKETPLHIASRIAGAEQCVDMLIRCGADVNNDMDVC